MYDAKLEYLRGEMTKITENSFYRFDRERYLKCLENFKSGWDYYLSVLEIQIIELKLMTILDSLTFKYSRQPQFLRVLPDRLTTQNLKICKRIKISGSQVKDQAVEQMIKKVTSGNDEVNSRVVSTLKHIVEKDLRQKLDKELNKQGTTLDLQLSQNKDDSL